MYVLRSEPKDYFADGTRRLVKHYTTGVEQMIENAAKYHTFDSALYIPIM
jgi:hypothetical protein